MTTLIHGPPGAPSTPPFDLRQHEKAIVIYILLSKLLMCEYSAISLNYKLFLLFTIMFACLISSLCVLQTIYVSKLLGIPRLCFYGKSQMHTTLNICFM